MVAKIEWRNQRYGRISGGDLERWLLVFDGVWKEREDFAAIRGDPDAWVYSLEKISVIPNWFALYDLEILQLVSELLARTELTEEFVAAAKSGSEALLTLVESLPDRLTPNVNALPAAMAMLGNLEAIALYSRSINDMVTSAKKGDLSALRQAVSIDSYVLCFPFFLAGLRVDQLSGESWFTEDVMRAIAGPHRRRYDRVRLRWAEYLLRDQGAFEACTRNEIYTLLVEHLQLYDPSGIQQDAKAALFSMFKKWQKQAGIQNPRFGFSVKKKA